MINWMRPLGMSLILLGAICPLVGCEREVMEVQTPRGEVEVNENLDGGMEVETD